MTNNPKNKKPIAEYFSNLLQKLSTEPTIGGLVFGDAVIQYISLGPVPKAASVRLPPGVIREGRIIDKEKLLISLKSLRGLIDSEKKSRTLSVVLSLPTAPVYTQSFQIPNVGSEKISESAILNLKMLSPIPEDSAYLTFQLLGENTDHYEMLGAVAEKHDVDSFKEVLEQAGFTAIVSEFTSLSLARAVATNLGAKDQSSVILYVSSDGLQLLIVRGGGLYFTYFRSWLSIQGEARQISKEVFENAVNQEMQKVLNFALSRFRENITQIFLLAPGMETQIDQFLETRFGLKVESLVLPGWSLTPHWYAALGAAMRGKMDRSEDAFLSLSKHTAIELFKHEQALNFIVLWRNILGGVLAIFVILYGGTAYFLNQEVQTLSSNLAIFRITSQEKDLQELKNKANVFNQLVGTLKEARGATGGQWSVFVKRIGELATAGGVRSIRVEASSFSGLLTVTGQAGSVDAITNFKNVLSAAPDIKEVNLNITKISQLNEGTFNFEISFRYLPN
jgi:hypothetical protein